MTVSIDPPPTTHHFNRAWQTRMHACMHAFRVRVFVYEAVCMYICMYIVCTCMCLCLYVCTCMHASMYVCMHVCTCMYACMYVCITGMAYGTCIGIHVCACVCSCVSVVCATGFRKFPQRALSGESYMQCCSQSPITENKWQHTQSGSVDVGREGLGIPHTFPV